MTQAVFQFHLFPFGHFIIFVVLLLSILWKVKIWKVYFQWMKKQQVLPIFYISPSLSLCDCFVVVQGHHWIGIRRHNISVLSAKIIISGEQVTCHPTGKGQHVWNTATKTNRGNNTLENNTSNQQTEQTKLQQTQTKRKIKTHWLHVAMVTEESRSTAARQEVSLRQRTSDVHQTWCTPEMGWPNVWSKREFSAAYNNYVICRCQQQQSLLQKQQAAERWRYPKGLTHGGTSALFETLRSDK